MSQSMSKSQTKVRPSPQASPRLNDPEVFENALKQLEASPQILLLLPPHLYGVYQKPLQKRFSSLVRLAQYPSSQTEDFDYVLSFQVSEFMEKPKQLSYGEYVQETLFHVKGAPDDLETLKPVERAQLKPTLIEKKFLKLQETTVALERKEAFAKLVYYHEVLRQKALQLKARQAELQQIDKKISKVDQAYYHSLSYVLVNAVEKITGVGEKVEAIMKTLMKVLIIDDLQQLTVEGLIPMGFNRKNLFTMSTYELQLKYNAFLGQHIKDQPLEHLTIRDFLIQSPELEQYDIVVLNFWRFQDEKLPVQVRIKKKTIYGKKEQKQLEKDPQQLAEERKKLEDQHQAFQQDLKELEAQIRDAEATGDLPEQHYQALVKKRKRLVKRLGKQAAELKKKQTPRSKKVKFLFYTQGLIQTLREHQTMKERFEEAVFEWQGIGDLLKAYGHSKEHLKIPQLKKMLKLSQSRHQVEVSLEKLQGQTAALQTKMEKFAKQHQFEDSKLGYPGFLEQHHLDKLELAVLGCCISQIRELLHPYPGTYFQMEEKKSPLDQEAALSQAKIYIASKAEHVPTTLLQQFFHIQSRDRELRIDIESELPSTTHFLYKAFNCLIVDLNDFSVPDIEACLQTRNESAFSHIPVLLLDNGRPRIDLKDRLRLHLRIGMTVNEHQAITLHSAPYQVSSLSEESSLFPVLAQAFGVPFEEPEATEAAAAAAENASVAAEQGQEKSGSKEDGNEENQLLPKSEELSKEKKGSVRDKSLNGENSWGPEYATGQQTVKTNPVKSSNAVSTRQRQKRQSARNRKDRKITAVPAF